MRYRLMSDKSKPLSIREKHTEIECMLHIFFHPFERDRIYMSKLIAHSERFAEILIARYHPSKGRFDDRRSTHTNLESIDRSPESSPLRSGSIEDRIDDICFSESIFSLQDGRSDFYKVRVEDSLIVLFEYACDLWGREMIYLSKGLIRFRDHLHDGILDTIMDHFYVVTRSIGTDMRDTRIP